MGRRPTAAPLNNDQAEALFRACGKGLRGARDRALFIVLWRLGLRAAEACHQERADIRQDGDELLIRVTRPKRFERGAPQRELALEAASSQIVLTWMALEESKLLFPTRTGGKMHTSHIRRLLPTLARRAGLERRVHPHCMRSTFARDCYEDGLGVREIQLALGHESLEVTQVYLEGIGASQLTAALRARSLPLRQRSKSAS